MVFVSAFTVGLDLHLDYGVVGAHDGLDQVSVDALRRSHAHRRLPLLLSVRTFRAMRARSLRLPSAPQPPAPASRAWVARPPRSRGSTLPAPCPPTSTRPSRPSA